MSRSPLARLGSLCRSTRRFPAQLRPFFSSCPIREEHQQSFLKSKWFPNVTSSPPSKFMPDEESQELVEKGQSEDDGSVWRTTLTRDPRPKPPIMDVSKLFDEDGSVTIDPVYLRDSCKCSLCVDESTLQRKFVTAHIPSNIKAIFQGRSGQGKVKVKWKNDIADYPADHQSVYSQDYLRSLTSPYPDSPVARKRHHWDRETFAQRATLISYADFVKDTEAYKAAMSALHRDGLIFITEVDAYEHAVGRMARRLGPLRSTFYGSTWDVKSVADSKNVAYTNQHLGFHMDLLYMTNPPGYQLLHCLKNSCAGGESRFADAFFAATRLRRVNQKAYRLLCRYPVEWRYDNDGQYYVQRRPTFQTVYHFVDHEEMARHQLTRQENMDNDADLAYVNWSPPFQGQLYYNLKNPGRTRKFVEAVEEFDHILNSDDMVVELKLGGGTCAIFENRRVVHARNAFEVGEGERWLRGAYVDEDVFWSKCAVLGADQYDTSNIPQPEEPNVRLYNLPIRRHKC